MSADTFTKVSEESWFGRIGGAIKGILFGLLLFVVAFPLLFWNEGRAVKRYKTLKEGAGAVVSVAAENVDPANEAKLVHVTGRADTDATLTDAVFGVTAKGLKLNRVVEMYQWKESSRRETRKKVGGGTRTVTTYTYNKTWSDSPIRSAGFEKPEGHRNPETMPYRSSEETADEVTLGAYVLSPSLVARIRSYEPLALGSDVPLPPELEGKARRHDGGYYIGADPSAPQVGDVRIRFEVARPADVSVVAKQTGQTFAPYVAKAGGTIELLQAGVHPADAMFQKAQQSNRLLTWGLRLLGFVLMLFGLNLMLRPLSVLADVLPILGNIVGAGTGLIAFLIAATLSLLTIAIAWIFYRPRLGISLLVAAVGLTVFARVRLKSAKARAPAAGVS